MIQFVNAKINIGLQIVGRRADGYHDLQTVFYPVGLHNGTFGNPDAFCDILEITECVGADPHGNVTPMEKGMPSFRFGGRRIDCPMEKNLVYKAARLFRDETGIDLSNCHIALEKHLPDGAGMGGGSADASFVLRGLAETTGMRDLPLKEWALRLGADCPFFIDNRPVYATGVGERFEPVGLNLQGYWLAVAKPRVYISTKEAFAGVKPHEAEFDLRDICRLPVSSWQELVKNDFEESIIPRFPVIGELKERMYHGGAEFSLMTGSGSCVYGIWPTEDGALNLADEMRHDPTIEQIYLLEM